MFSRLIYSSILLKSVLHILFSQHELFTSLSYPETAHTLQPQNVVTAQYVCVFPKSDHTVRLFLVYWLFFRIIIHIIFRITFSSWKKCFLRLWFGENWYFYTIQEKLYFSLFIKLSDGLQWSFVASFTSFGGDPHLSPDCVLSPPYITDQSARFVWTETLFNLSECVWMWETKPGFQNKAQRYTAQHWLVNSPSSDTFCPSHIASSSSCFSSCGCKMATRAPAITTIFGGRNQQSLCERDLCFTWLSQLLSNSKEISPRGLLHLISRSAVLLHNSPYFCFCSGGVSGKRRRKHRDLIWLLETASPLPYCLNLLPLLWIWFCACSCCPSFVT